MKFFERIKDNISEIKLAILLIFIIIGVLAFLLYGIGLEDKYWQEWLDEKCQRCGYEKATYSEKGESGNTNIKCDNKYYIIFDKYYLAYDEWGESYLVEQDKVDCMEIRNSID